MKNFLKNLWEKYSGILITTIVAIIIKDVVDITEITEKIASGKFPLSNIMAFIVQELLIVILSLAVTLCINRFGKYYYRYKIQKNKFNPLNNMTVYDKHMQIEEKLKCSQQYANLLDNSSDKYKLYYYKQLLYSLEMSMNLLLNLIYYKDECITAQTDIPTRNKFSLMDFDFYLKEINSYFNIAKNENLAKLKASKSYEANEIKFLETLLKRVEEEKKELEKSLNM